MSLKDCGVPTVAEVIQMLQDYPQDAHVLVYEELAEVERGICGCNSGIRIVDKDSPEESPKQIGFFLTGH